MLSPIEQHFSYTPGNAVLLSYRGCVKPDDVYSAVKYTSAIPARPVPPAQSVDEPLQRRSAGPLRLPSWRKRARAGYAHRARSHAGYTLRTPALLRRLPESQRTTVMAGFVALVRRWSRTTGCALCRRAAELAAKFRFEFNAPR